MKKIKKLLLGGLCFLLGAALTLVGTLAYFQDETDTAFNVMTSGNVHIEQLELERKDANTFVKFTKGKPADPAVYNAGVTAEALGAAVEWAGIGSTGANALYDERIGNVVDHVVFVKNTGSNAAYIRTVIAIEAPVGLNTDKIHTNVNKDGIKWETIDNAEINGVNYIVMVATYEAAVAGGTPTAPSLLQLYLDPTTVNEDAELFGDTWDVLVLSQAVQTTGFQAPENTLAADYALDMAFGEITATSTPWTRENDPKPVEIPAVANTAEELAELIAKGGSIILADDMKIEDILVVPAGVAVELDLNGYTISKTDSNDAVANTELFKNYGDLTISDSVGTGSISYLYTGANLGTSYAANTITTEPGSTLTVKSGTIINNTYDQATIAYAIDARTNGSAGDVSVIIEGGTITALRQSVRVFANSTTKTGSLKISGGDITGRVIVQNANANANKATLEITGGIFNPNEYKSSVLYVGGSNGATIDMQPVISGGVFNGEIECLMNCKFISGGVFAVDPSAFVAEDYVAGTNLNGTYTVYPENDTWDGTIDTSWYDEVQNTSANPANTKTDYYLYTAEQFAGFASIVNSDATSKIFDNVTVHLAVNVDLNGAKWTPIGSTFNTYEFSGNFDGMNHTVSNFTVASKAGSALFGFVRNSSTILASVKNLTVKNVTATGGDYVAGVVGQLYGTMDNCHAINVNVTATPFIMDNGIYDGGAKAGGVVGWIESGAMYSANNCTATDVTVKAYRDLGGVIGMAHNNNTVTNNKTYGANLSFVQLADGALYSGNTKSGNIGAVIGRRGSNVVESGSYYEDVVITVFASTTEALQDAFNNGYNVILANNITLTEGVVVPAGKTVVLDLNGKVLSYKNTVAAVSCAIANKGELTIKNGTVTYEGVGSANHSYGTNTITNEGKLTVDGAILINTTKTGSSNVIDNAPGATLVVNGGTLTAELIAVRIRDGANATFNGGEVTGKYAVQVYLMHNNKQATSLTINGGTFSGRKLGDHPIDDYQAVYSVTSGACVHEYTTVTITGGTFNGNVSFGGRDKTTTETVTVTGGTFNGYLGRYLANDGWQDIAKP